MIKLDKVGRAYIKNLKNLMIDLGIYEKEFDKIFLEPIGIQWQLYQEALEEISIESEELEEDEKTVQAKQMRMQRAYKNVMDMVKSLGLTPAGIFKLKAIRKPNEKEDNKSELDKIISGLN